MSKKIYQRSIRINGKPERSPQFTSAADADHWYDEMKRKKQFMRGGIVPRVTDKTLKGKTVAMSAAEWLKEIKPRYEAPTFGMYEEKTRLHIIPKLGRAPIASLTPQVVKRFLQSITDDGFSRNTRNKVKVTLSLICQREVEQDVPLLMGNPTLGIKFNEKRQSLKKKMPEIIRTAEDVVLFIDMARRHDLNSWFNSALGLLAGLRKGEKIALKWSHIDFNKKYIRVCQRFEQASNAIRAGTKNDENAYRIVPMPDELFELLTEGRELSPFPEMSDFVISDLKGRFHCPRKLHELHTKIAQKLNMKVTDHGLRHTFGAHFVANGGDIRTLKEILGHETLSQTDKYTQLSELIVMSRRNVVKYRGG